MAELDGLSDGVVAREQDRQRPTLGLQPVHGTEPLSHRVFLFGPLPSVGGKVPAGYGYDLWVVYAVWVAVVAMMYPLCLWFARLKQRKQDPWISYL